jgi:hypothetical protein
VRAPVEEPDGRIMDLDRRDFLRVPAGMLIAPAASAAAAAAGTLAQSYGSVAPRTSFRDRWSDLPGYPFGHEAHPTFHRLRASLDALHSRCEQPIVLREARPLRVEVKLLCHGEAGRTLLTLGIKSSTHGQWAFSIGAAPTRSQPYAPTGRQIVVNAADPWTERVSASGLTDPDFHTFTLVIADRSGPVRLYCDGQRLLDLSRGISDDQRRRVAEDQRSRHGSIQQLVPETPGSGDYLFIESRHPGQVIDLDRLEVSQDPPRTSRRTLPVLRDLDWETSDFRLVENPLARFERNPILKASDVPDPTGRGMGADHIGVIKDDGGFHMYFNAPIPPREPTANSAYAVFHAFSKDGLDWEVSPRSPVLEPGGPGEWDEGSLGQRGILKENGLFRMWYGGYASLLRQGRAGYAESRDGIRWTKPKLGLHTFGGRPTNIVLPLQEGLLCNEYELPQSVVHADEAPASRRYSMFLHTQGAHGFIVDVATSRDGRRWVRRAHNARTHGFGEEPRPNELHPAAVVLHEPDYYWACVGHHSSEGRQLRLVGWTVEPEERENVGFGLWRSQRPQLHPAAAWEREAPRVGTFIEVGDEWWVYYSSSGNVGLARVGRHRAFGFELLPGRESGQLTSIGFRASAGEWPTRRFVVNASGLGRGAAIRGELVDGRTGKVVPGFSLADSADLSADGYRLPLRWKSARPLPAAEALRVRLRVERGAGNPQVHGLYLVPLASAS